MRFLYDIAVGGYAVAVKTASAFNTKARLFCSGRKGLLRKIETEVSGQGPLVWFHCASVGEFEQARPVIEWYRKERPGYKRLLTFFSPSGYELRKNYPLADWVFYLPLDTPARARAFVRAIRPAKAIFIKYEFWYHYLHALQANGTETYLVSAIFRPSQPFFKRYGGFFRKMLGCYTRLFVQDEASRELLAGIGIRNVTVCGDTRFDRVYEITRNGQPLPLIRDFCGTDPVLVAGSTWEPDEQLLARVLREFPALKIIIAPHEIHPERIRKAISAFSGYSAVKYSDLLAHRSGENTDGENTDGKNTDGGNATGKGTAGNGTDNNGMDNNGMDSKGTDGGQPARIPADGGQGNGTQENSGQGNGKPAADPAGARLLILDCLGMLSSVYRYGQLAYIGGGFGVGIHNILEAATYGCPVLFGPNYRKFREARELIAAGGAWSVSDAARLQGILEKLTGDPAFRESAGAVCRRYVEENLGATGRIVREIEKTEA